MKSKNLILVATFDLTTYHTALFETPWDHHERLIRNGATLRFPCPPFFPVPPRRLFSPSAMEVKLSKPSPLSPSVPRVFESPMRGLLFCDRTGQRIRFGSPLSASIKSGKKLHAIQIRDISPSRYKKVAIFVFASSLSPTLWVEVGVFLAFLLWICGNLDLRLMLCGTFCHVSPGLPQTSLELPLWFLSSGSGFGGHSVKQFLFPSLFLYRSTMCM